jgi:UDP-N-acetylmuramyl pentapeptide phosphotransferase/UDP-N-acetylglucosamine-1-phosphate transferase
VAPTAAIFIAVGFGALTVALLHDPMGLVPHPPYGRWILVRLLVLASLALLGMLLVFGVVDDRADIDETDDVRDRVTFWRAIGLAFMISALASATFVAVSALVDHLDGAAS